MIRGPHGVVVVGASLAGVTAADRLRALGYEGRVTLIGDEHHLPYSRPPLSKGVLRGSEDADSVMLPAFTDADITVRTGSGAVRLDPVRRRVLLGDGEDVPYDGLVIATGARARRLATRPGAPRELVVRTLDDCLRLRDLLVGRPSVVIVGGGFVGMEVASTCAALGADVRLVHQEPPLARQLGPFLAGMLTAAARKAEVVLVPTSGGVRLHGDTHVRTVVTGDGTVLDADVVVTAVGDLPNRAWLADSGLPGTATSEDNGLGLPVDSRCRLAPNIVVAGDVSAVPGSLDGRRSPFWASARDQANTAAAALLTGDEAAPYQPAPYFWTDQFGLSVKICGPLPTTGMPEVVEGSIDDRAGIFRWPAATGSTGTCAAVNHRVPLPRLRRLAAGAA